MNRTAHLDEFGHISRIKDSAGHTSPFVSLGIGDDGAVLTPLEGEKLVVTTDLLVEDVHFRRDWMHPRFLGRKALRVNLSDLAAMGATARACLLSIAIPPKLGGDFLQSIVDGLLEDAAPLGISLVGGDLSASSRLMVSVTAIGGVAGPPLVRAAARPGDTIGVIGQLGWAKWGLEILEKSDGSSAPSSPPEIQNRAGSPDRERAIEAQLLPPILLSAGTELAAAGVRAAIDISDGLGQDLGHVLAASGVSAEVSLDSVEKLSPASPESERWRLAMEGGEDYALLFTARADKIDTLETEWARIGTVAEGPPQLWLCRGEDRRLYRGRGYDHFA